MQVIGFANAVSVIPLGFDPALFFPDQHAERLRERR